MKGWIVAMLVYCASIIFTYWNGYHHGIDAIWPAVVELSHVIGNDRHECFKCHDAFQKENK